MRTVYLGTSELAAGVLSRLAGSAHRPALVLTRPDRPKGRGRRTSPPPVADRARELSIPLSQPESVNSPEAIAEIDAAQPDVVVVCAFGALIREPLLSSHQMLNVHPSLLPRWRGAAPIERAIIAGDDRTGVSIMRLTAGLDSGPVCLSAEVEIGPEEDHGSLSARLCDLGGDLIVRALDMIESGQAPAFAEQDDSQATYAEKIEPADRLLDPGRGAAQLERVVRALHPHIGARLSRPDGSMLGVLRARAAGSVASSQGDAPAGEMPAGQAPAGQAPAGQAPAGQAPAGQVPAGQARAGDVPAGQARAGDVPAGELANVEGRLLYGTAEGALELLEVQPPGRRAMDAQAFLRGHAL